MKVPLMINRMITIGIDANEANVSQRVGVHQYAFEILWQLYRIRRRGSANLKYIVFLKKKPLSDLPKSDSHWQYKILGNFPFWVLTRLTFELLVREKVDVFFTPTHYLPLLTRTKLVCTIHDLGYLSFTGQFKKKDFWQLKYWSAKSIYISKYIITFSKNTKQDIVRRYKTDPKKIFVIPHGIDRKKFTNKINQNIVRQTINKYNISKNYILFLATIKPSKNVVNIIKAYLNITKKYKEIDIPQLIIAGKKGWMYEEFDNLLISTSDKNILYLGYVDEADKPALIAGSRLFLSPSYWEGFGMHVAEAMACGVPVLVSRRASLPEVAGDAGIYTGTSENDIQKGIEKVIFSDKLEYNKYKEGSIRQAEKFSWYKTGEETADVLIKACYANKY